MVCDLTYKLEVRSNILRNLSSTYIGQIYKKERVNIQVTLNIFVASPCKKQKNVNTNEIWTLIEVTNIEGTL